MCAIQSADPAFGQVDEEPDLTAAEVAERGCQTEPPCGLQILGTERHESRRIDRQLRGRSGRQGDPGASLFFLSLEDDLMRLFMPERVAKIMDRLGADEDEVITHPWITKSIERAQKRVEMQNFDARKRLLEYDDVMNQQREVVYDLRLYALEGGEDLKGETWDMIEQGLHNEIDEHVPPGSHDEQWNLPGLRERLLIEYFLHADFLPTEGNGASGEASWSNSDDLAKAVVDHGHHAFHRKLEGFGDLWEQVLRFIVLSVLDEKWKDHLYDLDHLRDSIRYRAYGQKDPLVEYKKEAYEMFVDLLRDMRQSVANRLYRAQLEPNVRLSAPRISALSGPTETAGTGAVGSGTGPGAAPLPSAPRPRQPAFSSAGVATAAAVDESLRPDDSAAKAALATGGRQRASEPVSVDKEPGRNDPCPCGSGRKYKKCHGKLA